MTTDDFSELQAKLAIATGEVIEGRLPTPVLRIVRDWTRAHRIELEENWERARQELPVERIPGADVD